MAYAVNDAEWNIRTKGALECFFDDNDLCRQIPINYTFQIFPNTSWVSSTHIFPYLNGPKVLPVGVKDKYYAMYDYNTTSVGDQASLVSPVIDTNGASVCVSFAYFTGDGE